MRGVRRVAGLALSVAILILGWRFAHANSTPVRVDYLAVQFSDLALWAALAGAFAGGAALASLLALYQIARLSLVVRRARKAVLTLEAEVHQLRSLPLREEPAGESEPPPVRGPEALARGA